MSENEFQRLKQIVRIVALLHDIGHAPFSHVGESDGIFPGLIDYDGEAGVGHEIYSRLIVKDYFKEILETNFKHFDLKVEEILAFMKGNVTNPKYFFAKDLISSQLDMDRMDYLLRDSHYCGVKYGVYDLSRLLDTLTICEPQQGIWQLGVESDGVQAVEEFVFARYWMFIQVYFHKPRRIFDYYLVNFLKERLDDGKYPISSTDYSRFTDNYILELIRENLDNIWAKNLYYRKSMKEVFVSMPHQLDENPSNDSELNQSDYHKLGWIDQEFRRLFPVSNQPENYYVDQAKTSSAKNHIEIKTVIGEEEDEVKLYAIPVKDKHTQRLEPIQKYSLSIKALSDKKINIVRIYARRVPITGETKTIYEKVNEFCQGIDENWSLYIAKTTEDAKQLKDLIEQKQRNLENFNKLGKTFE